MSSSEDYLDSLLDSILGGGKPDDDEKPASEEEEAVSAEDKGTVETGKAMSPDEIEEMLVSMGTLDGSEEESQEEEPEVDDMEAMLAFMNEHNASIAEEAQADSFSLDDLELGEGDFSYKSVDDLPSEEPGTDDIEASDLSDLNLEELSLDNLDLGEDGVPEDGLDAFSLDSLDSEEPGMEEAAQEGMSDFNPDDLSLDDLSLDDLSLDDFGLGDDSLQAENTADEDTQDSMSDFNLDELSLDDLDIGEDSGTQDVMPNESVQDGMPDFGLDSLSLDDLSSEEPEPGTNGDDLMSIEEIDRLLSGDMSFEEEPGAADDLALEESGDGDDDLSALLAGMDHDEDLSEIQDLLGESEQGVPADEDMLAMLEGVGGDDGAGFDLFENDEAAREAESIRELTPEEIAAREGGDEQGKKKKKRKKLFGKKKDKGGDEQQQTQELGTELEDLLGEVSLPESDQETVKEKKPGLIARLMDFLLESDEEDEDPLAAEVLADSDGVTGNISGENRELLRELGEEDKKGKKKKKEKKPKKEKEKEKEKKPKKEKKKKPKKEKAPDPEADLFAPPEKRLSKKKVICVFLFCGTIAACIILATSILPNYVQEQEARLAYDQKEYKDVYDLLYGKELKEEDEILFMRSELILQMDRKLSSYENYVNLNMRLEALDALISGVARYQLILADAEAYNVVSEVTDLYVQILGRLSTEFGVSEADALDIIGSKDDVIYSQRLMAIIDGTYASEAEEISGERQDVLPEEEEIIERIDGLEEENPDTLPEEELQNDQLGEDIQGVDSQPEEEMQDMLPEEEPAADENPGEGSEV